MKAILKLVMTALIAASTAAARAGPVETRRAESGPLQFRPAGSALSLTRIDLDQATQQILRQSSVKVLSAYTAIVDGREIHVIKILTPDGHIRYFRIDAETGNLIH